MASKLVKIFIPVHATSDVTEEIIKTLKELVRGDVQLTDAHEDAFIERNHSMIGGITLKFGDSDEYLKIPDDFEITKRKMAEREI